MENVIGVRFKRAGKIIYYYPGELEIAEGDGVIVDLVYCRMKKSWAICKIRV